jgi:DNA-binding transcriptional MerR regulator
MIEKSPEAFRTISEVADDLDLPQHVLRFWETRFSQIKPMKRGGGRRYYRPEDVSLLKGIRHLLYGEGYTIKGVQRILKENGARHVASLWVEAEDAGEESEAMEAHEAPPVRPAMPQPPLQPAARQSQQAGGLPREAVSELRTALYELVECKRMLDNAVGRG